ncbi:MAG TPA: hypothetical protein VD994_14010 [Prosthecobacter sp.]|nr:hypothetical protein [Prosthecobacter sp.]
MNHRTISRFAILAALALHAGGSLAQSTGSAGAAGYQYSTFSALSSPVTLPGMAPGTEPDWVTGMGLSLGGIIFPHVHVDSVYGTATRDQEELRVGHHDPVRRDGITVQNLEFSISGRINEYHEFFITYAGPIGEGDSFDGIVEEWFWKFKNLPGNVELRAGRVYNRFGIQNTYHPHGFDWVDQYLVNGRILGDDSLTTIGAELSWRAPLPWTSQFDVALGVAPEHEAHDHGGFTGQYSAEESHFAVNRVLGVANWTNVYNYNDFHQFRAGLSGAWGENHSGYQTSIYGAHFEYQWRENGFEAGGRYFRVRSEAMFNRYKVEDELGLVLDPVTQQDFGCYVSMLYGLPNNLELGLRGEYVPGNGETVQDARLRVSPGVTWYANANRNLRLRLQYNYDHSNAYGSDHGIWAQVSLTWGGPEVR